ncbi:hypothetical protein BDV29DRAFT_151768 [Aspergillus leporis]|uniref:Ketoreductase (KR) domain-containing protein n=1 Tax=Aspergillus leporis TaxID=41062 RepID=A0A5N5XJ25_9EURO|nr:hypothetical protein BDV29DRAFT_151768 [Aspergillus leporis]
MLSSLTGIVGNRDQGNYAAGNTFEDAFARHLVKSGQRAATIDLGYVSTVGYSAENQDASTSRSKGVVEQVSEREIHALVEYFADPRNVMTETTCQLVNGTLSESTFRERHIPTPAYMKYPLFSQLKETDCLQGHQETQHNPDCSIRALLNAAQTKEMAAESAFNAIQRHLAYLFNCSEDDIHIAKSVQGNGFDSLIAMEFRTWVVRSLELILP